MKEYGEVIFVDQLKHHRVVASQIDKTRAAWQRNSSWYAAAQREHYSQYATISAESRKKYGDKIYGYYAKRNRLRPVFNPTTRSKITEEDRHMHISMAHLFGYKYSKTTNGEYGSVAPSALFFCF
ncbi:uncharacterized protein LOC119548025 [Drosophila subpulchrella]|uniref:uncharacterized protein LOC119548025 n=1 Tax=Drosophila subpulchrella TaxID=1486046 RepID=UPI0018A15BE2|nr:uncharacterized protein LOC119548025 [Drosophila subpulchrella]